METGHPNTMLKTNLRNNFIEADQGSLQLNLLIYEDGLEYAVFHKDMVDLVVLRSFAFQKRTTNPGKLEAYIDEIIREDEYLNMKYESVKVTFYNHLATIIPNELYDVNNQREYLKFGIRLLEGDRIYVDDIPGLDAKVIYIPYMNVVNYLIDKYGEFEFIHAAGVLARSFFRMYKKDVTNNFFVNINNNSLDIIYFEEGKLQYFNSFLFSAPEDVLYYILFSMEQLGLSTDTQPVYLSGNITKDTPLYELLYNYIRKLRFIKEGGYAVSDDFYEEHRDSLFRHQHFILLNQI